MAAALAWLINRFRPREGWASFLLLLVTVLSVPAALLGANDTTDPVGLIFLTALAVVVGLRFARSRISARAAAILGGLLGIALTLILVGRLLPSLSMLWSELGYAVEWHQDRLNGVIRWPLPFASTAGFLWQKLNSLGQRLWWWGQTVAGGGQTLDRIVLLLLTSFLAWSSALFATWQIYRRRSAATGLVPGGAAVAIIAFFRGGLSVFYLAVYLFCTLCLLAICHLWAAQERWERTGTDYPGNLGVELTFSLTPLLIVVLAVAVLFPVVYSNPLSEGFWRLMDAPWSRVERVAEQFFGPIESGYSTGVGSGAGTGGELPRSHLLGGGPELGETIVLYVSTNDPPPPTPVSDEVEEPEPAYPHRYWRGRTYDTYAGLGWDNGPLERRSLAPSQALEPATAPGFDLLQQYQRVVPQQQSVYVANAPYRLDQPVEVWSRAPGDLAQLTGEADVYTVLSHAPQPTVQELRARSPITSTLPPGISERYTALPDTVPQRVLDLAHQVAGDASTRYEQAWAIEQYLRTYHYTLDLPDPPKNRDLVDYFLFDLQEGYCDYYASAMVVMARAVGVPARLASGYAQGTFDPDTGRWIVTEKDGHSWVEVYFEGIGWVEFEPTSGLPALVRSGGEDLSGLTVPPLPTRPIGWWQRVPWGLVALGAAVLLLLALVVWIWRPRPAVTASDLILDRQARLLRWGVRLGHPLRDGQTAHEYSQDLGQSLRTRSQNLRLHQARQAGIEAPGEIEDLAKTFARARYGPDPMDEREGWHVRDLWTRLRRRLSWLWLALGIGRRETPLQNTNNRTDPRQGPANET
jgi:transglutaminase-like putative cysteine protease